MAEGMQVTPMEVGELTDYIKEVLSEDEILRDVQVKGEVSNFTLHASGHAYFSIKDAQAVLSCVKFKAWNGGAPNKRLSNGAMVVVRGSITVYPPRGSYQMQVREIIEEGDEGDLYKQFMLLKAKLEQEGLFAAERKKPLPMFPLTIGLVTSKTGAVLQDIMRTIERRFPKLTIVLAPALMQGDTAPPTIIKAIDALEKEGSTQIIIVARGGGSLEDLWCFNDEAVVRRLVACKVPTISAVGHETDFSLCDFVADVRAATPTASAEMVTENLMNIEPWLEESLMRLKREAVNTWELMSQKVDELDKRLGYVLGKQMQIQELRLTKLEGALALLDPTAPLSKGYTATLKDGERVLQPDTLMEGDEIETRWQDGSRRSVVKG